MIYSYNWLREYVADIPEAKKLMTELSLHSVEVEEIDEGGIELGNVVVGELIERRTHPNADSLNIGIFDVGEPEPRQIIFGGVAALKVGDKLPVALAPTIIPDEIKIKERKLRGELSQGMCCLKSELGILDREEAVHFFEPDVINGTPIIGVLPLNETVIDIDNKSMTHRADLFCHTGIAREISAVFNLSLNLPKTAPLPKVKPTLDIKIADTNDCPRYIGIELSVNLGKSPDFISQRLQACGVKSINNVVDITNYIMLEFGEPTHAFDADKLSGNSIEVRRARTGETIATLDHETKTLTEDVLLITNNDKAIAVAGVIGGTESSVTDTTTRIILEVANFSALTVRRSAKIVGLRTDGALRWEKGLSPELAEPAAARAVELLLEYAGAKVIGLTDVYPKKPELTQISLSADYLSRLSGFEFEPKVVQKLLTALGCKVVTKKSKTGKVYNVEIPWWRTDLVIREDLVEEIVRLYGVNKIPEQQLIGALSVPNQDLELEIISKIQDHLVRCGLTETYNYSFYGADDIIKMGWDDQVDHLSIQNPLSEDLRYLRTSILPRLLDNIRTNQMQSSSIQLFEVGHLYFSDREVRQLALVISGGAEPYRVARGLAESLLSALNINFTTSVIVEEASKCPRWGMYQGKQALRFESAGEKLGTAGILSAQVQSNWDILRGTAFVTLSIPILAKYSSTKRAMRPISIFPSVPLDLSVIVDESVPWGDIEAVVRSHGSDLLQSIEVIDIYRGEAIPVGKKSLSFRVILQSQQQTLEMSAMEKWRDGLVVDLGKKLDATLRDK